MKELFPLLLLCLQIQGPSLGACTSALDPNGRHVCRSGSHPQLLICCHGWKQEGRECIGALCEGADACRENEVCVRPGICRCRAGFFGANCNTRCPAQYWGPDCKESCLCYPHGKCDPTSGQCTCLPRRWGPLCRSACLCGPHGWCDPLTGACQCEPDWWAPDCKRKCHCNMAGSRCDPATGRCLCEPGWWGRTCSSHCNCNASPCAQESGRCTCRSGWWGAACQYQCHCLHGTCNPHDGQCTCDAGYQGPNCVHTCPASTYGPQCRYSCGHCKQNQPCAPVDGFCVACDSGWNGTRCDQPCLPGQYGENCAHLCPYCFQGETCNPRTGECRSCDAGLMGAKCELPCLPGLFGSGCRSSCPDCFNGTCDPVSGECVCKAGYWGASCNQTCLEGFYGPNCSEPCQCGGAPCHRLSGTCLLRGKNQGALIAGIVAPLLVLLLCICCCCCGCCTPLPVDTDDRPTSFDSNPIFQVKHHVVGVLANLTTALPCFSLGGYKLPRVTVSHHDAEIPFTPSFIEPQSTVWPSDSNSFSSSFDMDDSQEPTYHLPRSEDPGPQAILLPEAVAALNQELLAIPRTSSITKARRPSVSFADGTRFGIPSPRGSTEALSSVGKPKTTWGSAHVASPEQPAVGPEQELPHDDSPARASCYKTLEFGPAEKESCKAWPESTPSGRSKRLSSSNHVARRVEALEAASRAQGSPEVGVTTIYVTVDKAEAGGPTQVGRGSLPRAKQEPRLRLTRTNEVLQQLPWGSPDYNQNARQSPIQDEAGLASDGPNPMLLPTEAQILLGKLPTHPLEEAGGPWAIKPPHTHNQPDIVIARNYISEEEEEEEEEPKYENISGKPQRTVAT